MSFSPIAFIAPNYRDFKNDYLKAYEPGTTTPKVIALDSAGVVQVAKLQLNADGFIISAGNAIVIPYIDGAYDLWLFPTEAEADANDTSNAERLADNLSAPGSDLINDLSQAYEFATVALYKLSDIVFPVGKIIATTEFSTGNGGGAKYIVVAGVTPGDGIVLSDTVNQSLTIQDPVNAQQFGYSSVSTSSAEIQEAIDYFEALGGGEFTINKTSGPTLITRVNMKDRVEILCNDDITFTDAVGLYAVNFDGTFAAKWIGGQISTTSLNVTRTGFNLQNNAFGNTVAPLKVSGFLNKGIDINTGSQQNLIYRPEIEGSTGSTGSGISIFGADGDKPNSNVIFEPFVHNCRGGISVQGGFWNKVIRPRIEDTTLWGIGLDGVVTDSGDGARYTYVEAPVVRRNINGTFGGIYFGNGSSNNKIVNPQCFDCTTGIRSSGGIGFEPTNNKIETPVIDGDTDNLSVGVTGIQISNAIGMDITEPDVKNLTGRGIYYFTSPNGSVTGGEVQDCALEGVYFQTKGGTIRDVHSHDNDYGFRVEFGGDADGTNRFFNCSADNNTTSDFQRGISSTVIKDSLAFVNENSANSSMANGQSTVTVTHGCDFTPSAADVSIAWRFNPEAMGAFWFENFTATTFDLKTDSVAVGVTGFTWRVKEANL